jgi:8-hydroxy-5-deazaflavin:NADPH oxidoreductase
MNLGIIGSGNVGGTLGTRWAQAGHQVAFASREIDSPDIQKLVSKAGPSARAATVPQAAAFGDVLVLATPWLAAKEALQSAGDLTGKVLLDATNPVLPNLEGLEVGTTTSGGEQVAGWARGAKLVKIFNTVGFNIMADPRFGENRAILFYCGDDSAAKKTAAQLAAELDFDPLDAGPLKQARLLEPFALLWITLANFYGYSRDIAFELLRR